jgi:hypothetical protein
MDEIKKKNQIVVARYNENLNWLDKFKDIAVIYNKGKYCHSLNKFEVISLPNVGRESHTYLYHIINNYENLAERTIFFQGKITDHKILNIEDYFEEDDFIGKLDEINLNLLYKKIEHHGKWKNEYLLGIMRPSTLTPIEWLTRIIGLKLNEDIILKKKIKMVWGANFSVSKEKILKKPKSFYENAIKLLENHINPEEGHYFERSWYLIFTNECINKPTIGYLFLKGNYSEKIDNILTKINNNENFKEFHLWKSIQANNNSIEKLKINYIPDNNKYIQINSIIENNNFNFKLKAKNDIHLLIEFENIENIYEVVLGGWDGSISVIRDNIQGKIIASYNKQILNNYEYLNAIIQIDTIFKLSINDNTIFEFDNIYEVNPIKNIKIKSFFGSSSYWDYNTENINSPFIKVNLCNNIYSNNYNKDIYEYYLNNYFDYYIKEVNLLEYIDIL